MKKQLTPFFVIAMVVDISSPKLNPLLKQPMGETKEVAVYPFRAKDPGKGASSCQHPLEDFLFPKDLSNWATHLERVPSGDLPLAATLRKIAFDSQFGLHSIDQVIIDVPIHGTHDSCGQDVCAAITHLNESLRKGKRRIRIQTLTRLDCRLPPRSRVLLEDASAKSAAQIVARALILLNPPSKPQESKVAQQAKDPFGTIHLQGVPVQLKFEWQSSASPGVGQSATEFMQAPISAHLRAGNWKVTVLSPSWLTNLPGWTLEVKSGENINVDLNKIMEPQVSWVQSLPQQDLMVELDMTRPPEFPARILVPRGGGPLPMPKTLAYKVYQIK